MKTKQILSIMVGVWMTLFGVASAQEATSSLEQFPQTKEEIHTYFDARSSEFSVQVEEKQKEIRAQFEIQKEVNPGQVILQDKLGKILSRIFERFEAVVVRFDGILERITARLEKLDEQNIDTSVVKKSIEEARARSAESIILISATQKELEDAVANGVSREQIRNSVTLCKESLKTTQDALTRVVEDLKNISAEEDISLEE